MSSRQLNENGARYDVSAAATTAEHADEGEKN
jgi:hypothetical protein